MTHQHTRTTYTPTSGYPIETRVTLPGDPWVTPSTKPQWTRPIVVDPVYISVTVAKVKIGSRRDKNCDVVPSPNSLERFIKVIKAEQVRFHAAPGRERQAGTGGGVGAARKLATAAMEASILAAMDGEMAAAQIAKLVNHATATTATALGRMVQDGRVIRRYHIDRVMHRQVGMYRRAEQ